ncbi:mechanosensitive ion channel family protein [Sulfurimonas sp. HSL3-7]|uniref:mechanosensitive ion channel family protein n=1 Tax=Sulfonitrofixus jiaomeiensis TaxID=3131938 RepID=UPI0031F74309
MKQTLLLLLLTLSLLGNDFFDDFFTQQIELERQLEDQNLSSDTLEEILVEEDRLFNQFFVDYITKDKKEGGLEQDLYSSEIFRLKRRIQANSQRGNTLAIMRDELKLATFALKQNIWSTMEQVVQAVKLDSYKAFAARLQEIIEKRHEKEPSIDLQKYAYIPKIADPDPLMLSVRANLDEYRYIQNIHNTLSAELIENAKQVYKAGAVYRYGILSLAVIINDSDVARAVDPYLDYVYLSSAKLVYITAILFVIYVVGKTIVFVLQRLLYFVSSDEEDIWYVFEQTTRPFTVLVIILASELVFTVYSGFSDVSWVITLYNIAYVFLVSFLVYRLGNAIAVVKMEQLHSNKFFRNEVVNLGLKVLNGLVGLTALIIILKILNVNLTAILSGLGIGGIAVAFAAKDTIANFFGSVSILLTDLFEQGDWIAVNDMEGTVVEIGLRATTIRTFDNALIAIPNYKLADNGIKNWSRRTMGRRIKMKIGVTYESDMEKIKKAIAEIREMLQNHPGIVTERTEYLSSERQKKLVSKEDLKGIKRLIMVYLDAFGSSSIDILVYCFSRSVIWSEWQEVKEDVLFKIAEILKANDLDFAYPAMTIHQAAPKD